MIRKSLKMYSKHFPNLLGIFVEWLEADKQSGHSFVQRGTEKRI